VTQWAVRGAAPLRQPRRCGNGGGAVAFGILATARLFVLCLGKPTCLFKKLVFRPQGQQKNKKKENWSTPEY